MNDIPIYDYHKFLGSGSFGFVVSAVDRETGEHVALKVNAKDLMFIDCRCNQWKFSEVSEERSWNTVAAITSQECDQIHSCKSNCKLW